MIYVVNKGEGYKICEEKHSLDLNKYILIVNIKNDYPITENRLS